MHLKISPHFHPHYFLSVFSSESGEELLTELILPWPLFVAFLSLDHGYLEDHVFPADIRFFEQSL
jgi:hypothetical protein